MSAQRRRTASSRTASASLAIEAQRVREFGFSASELDRAKKWMAAVLRARLQRARQDRERLVRAGIPELLPRRRAEPGHRVRVPPGQAAAAEHHRRRCLDDGAVAARRRQPRDPGHLAAEDRRQGADRGRAPGGAGRRRPRRASRAWTDTDDDAGADGARAGSRAPSPRAATIDDLGVTVVRLSNGVEAWLKPTDFKNDQVVFTMTAPGGTLAGARRPTFPRRRWPPRSSAPPAPAG